MVHDGQADIDAGDRPSHKRPVPGAARRRPPAAKVGRRGEAARSRTLNAPATKYARGARFPVSGSSPPQAGGPITSAPSSSPDRAAAPASAWPAPRHIERRSRRPPTRTAAAMFT